MAFLANLFNERDLPRAARFYILYMIKKTQVLRQNARIKLIDQNDLSRSIDPREIAHFSAMADQWWDPNGKFRALHELNPIRLDWIRKTICSEYMLDESEMTPMVSLSILDVGCGGGIISEPIYRMGADVMGIDASENNIQIATSHAIATGISIEYQCTSAEALVKEKKQFDVLLALEVAEHVADLSVFIRALSDLIKPGGAVILSTINRTPKSFLFAIVGAEIIMRMLPLGTHRWQKFIKPSELDSVFRDHSLRIKRITGLIYNPATRSWALSKDTSVNYIVCAKKEKT